MELPYDAARKEDEKDQMKTSRLIVVSISLPLDVTDNMKSKPETNRR
jgi:hypothetical protein